MSYTYEKIMMILKLVKNLNASIAVTTMIMCAAGNVYAAASEQTSTSATASMSASQRAAAIARLRKLIPSFNDGSPCSDAIIHLVALSAKDGGNPEFRETLEAARVGMHLPPDHWQRQGITNIFYGRGSVGELVDTLAKFMAEWCSALPTIQGNDDDGLKYIGQMNWFFYQNEAGGYFGRGRSAKGSHQPLVYDFMKQFSVQSGKFMDSPASTGTIAKWVANPRIEIRDYQPADDGSYNYKSWNQFFTRRLRVDRQGNIPSRPVAMPNRDYIISSPTDCIMNPLVQVMVSGPEARKRKFIENPLQSDTVLDVKGIPISIGQLLGDVPETIRQAFTGGTGLSCILTPASYHHFHAPVSGRVVYGAVIRGPTYGYNDWPNFLPLNRNVAQPGTDFSQFEVYQRAVVIIEVTFKHMHGHDQTGYVASIPVGLDTIGSVVLNKDIIPPSDAPKTNTYPRVKRGVTELGYFQYGGSLDLLLFSKGLANGSIQTRLGSQIGIINTH